MKKSESVPEFSKPKQLVSNECLALETLRRALQYHVGCLFCFSQLDVSSRELQADKNQNRHNPMKVVKIEGAFVLMHPTTISARFVSYVHIVKEPLRKTAQQVSMVSLSTTGLGKKDANNMWFPRGNDCVGSFINQLMGAMRRPLPKLKS